MLKFMSRVLALSFVIFTYETITPAQADTLDSRFKDIETIHLYIEYDFQPTLPFGQYLERRDEFTAVLVQEIKVRLREIGTDLILEKSSLVGGQFDKGQAGLEVRVNSYLSTNEEMAAFVLVYNARSELTIGKISVPSVMRPQIIKGISAKDGSKTLALEIAQYFEKSILVLLDRGKKKHID